MTAAINLPYLKEISHQLDHGWIMSYVIRDIPSKDIRF